MTELQILRNDLLKEWGNIKDAEAAYEFVMNYGEQSCKPTTINQQPGVMPDGIYIVQTDGKAVLFEGKNTKPTNGAVKGIGVKYGSRSLLVALQDAANDEEITLTNSKDNGKNGFYRDNYLDAVANWNGKRDTEHLKRLC